MLWMTSASELFHSRRYRFGVRYNGVEISGFDTSLPDASSSSSSLQHRTTNRRYNRRENRHDDGCDLASRRIHRRRLDHSEHESVHPEQVHNQSPTGSIINSEDFRSIHRHRATGNDRLPGSVLLARERLLERLRGVSVSQNRQSSSSSSNSHQDDSNLYEEMASESWQPLARNHHHHHPGLHQDALNCLKLEVFGDDGKGNETSRECTICLESFENGDEVIRLHCNHVFHSGCLIPWIRLCGACPNCRKGITVNVNVL